MQNVLTLQPALINSALVIRINQYDHRLLLFASVEFSAWNSYGPFEMQSACFSSYAPSDITQRRSFDTQTSIVRILALRNAAPMIKRTKLMIIVYELARRTMPRRFRIIFDIIYIIFISAHRSAWCCGTNVINHISRIIVAFATPVISKKRNCAVKSDSRDTKPRDFSGDREKSKRCAISFTRERVLLRVSLRAIMRNDQERGSIRFLKETRRVE